MKAQSWLVMSFSVNDISLSSRTLDSHSRTLLVALCEVGLEEPNEGQSSTGNANCIDETDSHCGIRGQRFSRDK